MFGLMLLMAAIGLGSAQEAPDGQLHGTVYMVDLAGSERLGTFPARLLVHRDRGSVGARAVASEPDIVLQTDAEGRFRASLPPGVYDVFVSSTVFGPTCAKLTIVSGRETRYEPGIHMDDIGLEGPAFPQSGR
jgi:hypothetical protein